MLRSRHRVASAKTHIGVFVTIVAITAAWGCLGASPAWATLAPAHLTGSVTDSATGSPITDGTIDVSAFVQNDSSWDFAADVHADASGHFDIGGLSAGTYTVMFTDESTIYATQYYGGQSTQDAATQISVATGSTTSGINAALARWSHITGRVTDASTGDPLASVDVSAYASDATGWNYAGDTYTDTLGNYDLGGLAPGAYALRFSDPQNIQAPQYYNGKTTRGSADQVTVGAGVVVPGIDAALTAGSHISGHVTDAATGNPISGEEIAATAYILDGSSWTAGNSAVVDAAGDYDIAGLAAGTYTVGFSSISYADQYYNGKATQDAADRVTLGTGAVRSGINAALVTYSHITGHVTDAATGKPVGADTVRVFAYVRNGSVWDLANDTRADSAGNYDLGALGAGTYTVGFSSGGQGSYADQYYSGKTVKGSADPVQVATSSITSGIDAALVAGAHITGRVTDATTGNPTVMGYATAYIRDGSAWDEANSTRTDATGYYDIGGLATGVYHVGFVVVSGYETQYYNGKATQDTADQVTVGAGTTSAHIDEAVGLIAPNTYTITPIAGPNGWISPYKTRAVTLGGGTTVFVGADTGYHVANVLVDKVSQGAVDSYTFSNVRANHSIAVTFAFTKLTTKLTISSNKGTAKRGQTVAFSGAISPNMANGTRVVVQICKVGSRAWATLLARGTYSRHLWSYSYKIPRSHARGTFWVRANYGGSATYVSCVSASRKLVIK
jgi:5-hydroxyisourate hydrolase-like protein (transthyretin family)